MRKLTRAQRRALCALAATSYIGGLAPAGALGARNSTMRALVEKGLATEHHRVRNLYFFRITDAGKNEVQRGPLLSQLPPSR